MKKPSIVFVHGIWADGSSFQRVVGPLLAEGHEVICAQYGLDTLRAMSTQSSTLSDELADRSSS
jgi:pimeloyl-ACP methyl ester carboxylesterase